MDAKLDIPLNGASVNIVKKSGDALCKILYDKFGCVATIEGVEKERESGTINQRQAQTISQEKRGEFMLHSRVKVSVWKADLTHFSADAVVNAANEGLQHYGGLAQALSKAGGPRIQRDCDDYVRKHGNVKTGKAVVFGAGSLPCKKIIHAVGPELSMNPFSHDVQRAKPWLEEAIRSILNRVEEHHLVNVAIPAISSGLFHYPLPECAHTIVSTIKCYYDKPPHRHVPQEIFLVNNDDRTVQEMEKACHHIFSPRQHQSYSHAAAKNTGNTARTPPPSIQMGNVLLTLKKGNIEEQKTDVIVNTASKDLKLSTGSISRAILNKAGHEMQNEIKTARMGNLIISTKPYKLSCKEVYHTFCIEKLNGPKAGKILYDSVLDCLWKAVASNYSSIAVPAIGTGALGFSGAESASIILDAVTAFAKTYPNKFQIYFVIFPSDDKIFQAFENQMRSLQNRSPPSFGPAASGPKDDSHTSSAPTPQISLLGPSDHSTHEAKKWLSDLLSIHHHTIKNNFISHFSETDHHQLSCFAENGLLIEEFMTQGHACIAINGEMKEDTVVAALEVEAMLWKIQKEFISEEEGELQVLSHTELPPKRETVNKSSKEFLDRSDAFIGLGLRVTKVDKVENFALKVMFDQKKKQLCCSSSKTMIQRIPAQFCEMISRIGFQAECAPPEDPKYGEGIYFTHNIKAALELWKEKGEEYLYFVEAEVLTGNSAPGKPGLNMPPPVGKDPNVFHDSVHGGRDVSVIFSGYQALPKYIIICKKDSNVSFL